MTVNSILWQLVEAQHKPILGSVICLISFDKRQTAFINYC